MIIKERPLEAKGFSFLAIAGSKLFISGAEHRLPNDSLQVRRLHSPVIDENGEHHAK